MLILYIKNVLMNKLTFQWLIFFLIGVDSSSMLFWSPLSVVYVPKKTFTVSSSAESDLRRHDTKLFCLYAMPLSFLCPILTENLFNEYPFHTYSSKRLDLDMHISNPKDRKHSVWRQTWGTDCRERESTGMLNISIKEIHAQ